MISLRPYQHEAIEAVRAAAKRGVRRPLIGLPTGTGKTVVFSAIVQAAAKKGSRCLILAHRDELLTQSEEKLTAVAPELALSTGFVKAKLNDHHTPVVIASVQTLSRSNRLAQIVDPFDIVIVDEAHHAAADSYMRVLDGLGSFRETGGPLTIGVTATPQRADGKDLGATWQEIVYHRDMLSMMREGYLCDLRGIRVKLGGLDLSDVRTTGGDYNDADLEEALEAADAPEHGVRAWHKYCAGRKTICFTPTIALAQMVAAEFRETGVAARALSGKTPLEERREMLRRFKTGEVQVIANAQVLTEGFDEPSVECVMIARPTKSQGMYVQMVGRGTRIAPGKKDCIVLDIVGATDRLDLTTLPRLFGLDEEGEQDTTEKVDADTDGEDSGSVLDWSERDEKKSGRITARQVELFARQEIAWVRADDGLWVLSIGNQSHIQLVADDDRWDVILDRKDYGRTYLAKGLDQGYAMGTAEDYARQNGASSNLVSRNAAWREGPASEKQVAALRRMKVSVPHGISRGEASDLLGAAVARFKRRDG